MSVYMTYSCSSQSTTYVVSCSDDHAQLATIKERLQDACDANTGDTLDPLMLHALITHEVFLEADTLAMPMRYQLYDQLDRVDKYAEQSSESANKDDLQDMTVQLNVVSQEVDQMDASADMASMIVNRLLAAHERYRQIVPDPIRANAIQKTHDSLSYLSQSIDAQKRWFRSYKARKDTAMNLVYNLVTQHNSTTSTTIAAEARADGASMKVIAALTMLFLPGTFLSSVFAMSIMDSHARWWWYVALTLPLTLLVIGTWYLWFEGPTILSTARMWAIRARLRRRKRTNSPV